ncbi:hypothetical protein HD598_000179 [Neomicrococcus aestuarii]|uniref:Uncharacterized protein n=1 Tax=Neomicrococcus aestuarii TaxID=556325 RepID=A0A7W8WYS3_9MICC|nr:hypothetical protein [Neomicrococcus aestuarii]
MIRVSEIRHSFNSAAFVANTKIPAGILPAVSPLNITVMCGIDGAANRMEL